MTKKPFVNLDGIPSEVHLGNDNDSSEILLGSNQTVILEKLYGPACFSSLRISAIAGPDWYWKIEMMNNATGKYEEMLRLRHEISYPEDDDQ